MKYLILASIAMILSFGVSSCGEDVASVESSVVNSDMTSNEVTGTVTEAVEYGEVVIDLDDSSLWNRPGASLDFRITGVNVDYDIIIIRQVAATTVRLQVGTYRLSEVVFITDDETYVFDEDYVEFVIVPDVPDATIPLTLTRWGTVLVEESSGLTLSGLSADPDGDLVYGDADTAPSDPCIPRPDSETCKN